MRDVGRSFLCSRLQRPMAAVILFLCHFIMYKRKKERKNKDAVYVMYLFDLLKLNKQRGNANLYSIMFFTCNLYTSKYACIRLAFLLIHILLYNIHIIQN